MDSPPFNPTEQDELDYLQDILKRLDATISYAAGAALKHSSDLLEIKKYLWENKDGMDHMEKHAVRQSVTRTAITGEEVVKKRERLMKLKGSPYFGRVDFLPTAEASPLNVYIGLHAFYDNERNRVLIHDWRAPLSGLFYDYETGSAMYTSPQGEITGTILLKRQYRIRKGVMEFMLESGLSIHDDAEIAKIFAGSFTINLVRSYAPLRRSLMHWSDSSMKTTYRQDNSRRSHWCTREVCWLPHHTWSKGWNSIM